MRRTVFFTISLLILSITGFAACVPANPIATPTASDGAEATTSSAQPTEVSATEAQPPETAIQLANCVLTPADGEGPYYIAGAPFKESIAPDSLPGDRLTVSGIVYSQDCVPLPDAEVDVWQADSTGAYDFSDQFILRGKVKSDASGHYQFETIMPGYYGTGGGARPLHIHVKVSHPNTAPLTTQIYFVDDPQAAGYPPALLIAVQDKDGVLQGTFNFVLADR